MTARAYYYLMMELLEGRKSFQKTGEIRRPGKQKGSELVPRTARSLEEGNARSQGGIFKSTSCFHSGEATMAELNDWIDSTSLPGALAG